MTGSFQSATELAVLSWIRDPNWTSQEDDPTGAPAKALAGEDVKNSPVAKIDIRLRENLPYRTARVTLDQIQDNAAYSLEIRGQVLTYTSSNNPTRDSIVQGIVDTVNAAYLDVRARGVDTDNDNDLDKVILESGYTVLTVDSTSQNTDYLVTIEGEVFSVNSGNNPVATPEAVMDDLGNEINGQSSYAKAFEIDHDNDNEVEALFIKPVDHGDLDITITPNAETTIHRVGREALNPPMEVAASLNLSMDLDAAELDIVRVYGLSKGENTPPGGWRVINEFENVSYRGLHEIVRTSAFDRIYTEIVNTARGSIRSLQVGRSTLE